MKRLNGSQPPAPSIAMPIRAASAADTLVASASACIARIVEIVSSLPVSQESERRRREDLGRDRQARQAPASPGRPGDRRLRDDRGGRPRHGLRLGRQGQLRAARHPDRAARAGAGRRSRSSPSTSTRSSRAFRPTCCPTISPRAASTSASSSRTPIRSSSAWCPKARRCAACARGCAAACSTASRPSSARPRSRSATTATTWCRPCS